MVEARRHTVQEERKQSHAPQQSSQMQPRPPSPHINQTQPRDTVVANIKMVHGDNVHVSDGGRRRLELPKRVVIPEYHGTVRRHCKAAWQGASEFPTVPVNDAEAVEPYGGTNFSPGARLTISGELNAVIKSNCRREIRGGELSCTRAPTRAAADLHKPHSTGTVLNCSGALGTPSRSAKIASHRSRRPGSRRRLRPAEAIEIPERVRRRSEPCPLPRDYRVARRRRRTRKERGELLVPRSDTHA
jgi:hypothetical protein